MKEASTLEVLAKKPANELSQRELNLVRRYQSYVRKLQMLNSKEARISKAVKRAQEQHQKLAARQSEFVRKIGEVEKELNKPTAKKEKQNEQLTDGKAVAAENVVPIAPVARSKAGKTGAGRA